MITALAAGASALAAMAGNQARLQEESDMFGKKKSEAFAEYKIAPDGEKHTVSRAFIILVDDNTKHYAPVPIPVELAEANLATISQLAAMMQAADGKGVRPN